METFLKHLVVLVHDTFFFGRYAACGKACFIPPGYVYYRLVYIEICCIDYITSCIAASVEHKNKLLQTFLCSNITIYQVLHYF